MTDTGPHFLSTPGLPTFCIVQAKTYRRNGISMQSGCCGELTVTVNNN
jgi:hypothetical protein